MRIIVSIVFILFLYSCGDSPVNEKAGKTKPKVLKKYKFQAKEISKKKEKQNKFVKLTPENALKYLKQYGKENPEDKVTIKTNLGDMKIRLYKTTPLHRANFIRLIKNKYYNDALFYRVVKGFIVQTGNSDEHTHANRRRKLGHYSIPAEFNPKLIHKRGAVSMSRSYTDNPKKESVPYDFFIVHGTVLQGVELKVTEPEYRRKIYGSIGGADHLDNEHTVFGEVTSGLGVIDKIANVKVDKGDWPIDDVKIISISCY